MADKEYLNLCKTILEDGVTKDDRTGVGTKSIFGYQMKFDLNKKNSNGMGLYIVSRILSNYGIEYRIEKSDIGFVFLIKL